MSRTNRHLAILIAWTAGLCAAGAVRADDSDVPKIQKVLAVEQADSLYGKYRIVFSISSPIAPPRNAVGTPTFYLGNQRVALPGDPRDATTIFGYVTDLPDANVMFKVISATPTAGMAAREPADEIAIEPRALLATSRVSRGGFEADYIRRSSGPVDVWSAWTSSDSVFVGELLRRDVDPAAPHQYRFYYKPGDVLRGSAPPSSAGMFVQSSPSPMYELELGGRYLVFARSGGTPPSFRVNAVVRIWWPQDDFVTSYLTNRAAIRSGDSALLRDFLVRELTSNPAVEARLAAANELAAMKPSLTPEQMQTLRSRAAVEPSSAVKSAFDRLITAR